MTRQAVFTISDADYAPMALTMFESVSKFYPDSDMFLFLIGTGSVSKLEGNVNVVYIADLLDDLDLSQRLAHYLQVEISTSIRPQCFQRLFEKYERAIYLDPDIYVFRRMTEVDDLLDAGVNGVVTPHALQSISDVELGGGDRVFLQCGIFNLGFLALKNTPETTRMLAWWEDKLKWKCIVDWPNGYFVDQKWLEFLPVYFEGFHILRLPTYNLAPWNAEHYTILSGGPDNFFVDNFDTPVAFIHFSGIRRMELHFLHMKNARRFYINELQKRKFQKLPLANYQVSFRGTDLVFDKVCCFLYKDYVKLTKDENSNPLVTRWFNEYIHSTDAETGFPIYIRKLYEILPDIFVGYLSKKMATNWDNMISLVKDHFTYDGVVSLETMIQLRNDSQPPDFEIVGHIVGTETQYQRAAQTLGRKQKRNIADNTKPDREITFLPDRIELRSGTVRVCIPHLDISGDLPSGLDAREYSEIWVPSTSSKDRLHKDGILNVTPILQPVLMPEFEIRETGLPFDKFIVMLRHDFELDGAAQDTESSLHAFREAFGDRTDVILLCYLANATASVEYKNLRAAATQPNIRIVEGPANDDAYYNYLRRMNCFISLHQETDFGYPLAEAMLLGKEVVATARGGSTHYTNPENSFLVNPDSARGIIKQAAKFLIEIHDNKNALDIKGRKAQLSVRKHLSPLAIGFTMQKRIEDLEGLQVIPTKAQSASISARAIRKLRRIKRRLMPPKIAPSAPVLQDTHQTDAVIKILLKNANRPAVLE